MRSTLLALIAIALILAVAGCGKGSEEPAPGSDGSVTREGAKRWPEIWCRVQPGDTREEIQRLMGPATEEYTAETSPSGFEPKMIWHAFEYEFTATFDQEGRARSLMLIDAALTEEQKANLKCDKARTLE